MRVNDTFEIKDAHNLRKEPGLVVVLDELVTTEISELIGMRVTITTPTGASITRRIDDAREHRIVNSFFFAGLKKTDVPVGSVVKLLADSKIQDVH